eukprot:c18805_g1_i3.p2 GENE.c18805_g1_i3~~c18805_g1_i3.p2  ORF type:complete len:104 (-),score=20.72 c18805_g1_i3:150-461(-)
MVLRWLLVVILLAFVCTCQARTDGRYWKGTEKVQLKLCAKCEPGFRVLEECSMFSNTKCVSNDAPTRFFVAGVDKLGIKACKLCPPGSKVIGQCTMFTDTVCE